MKRTTWFYLTHLSMMSCAFYLVISVGLLSSISLSSEKEKSSLEVRVGRVKLVMVLLKRVDSIITRYIIYQED